MDDADRATGRTTGLMLDAMAAASLHRGEWVEFHDHGDQSSAAAIVLRAVMQQMADALGLDYDITVMPVTAVRGRSRGHVMLRWPKEQTEPAMVAAPTLERLSEISTARAKVPSDMAVLARAVLSILERLDKG